MSANSYQWRVIIEVRSGFNPVSIAFYFSKSYEDAFEYLESRRHLENKKRHLFVKQLGSKHRHYHYDESFAVALLAASNTDADEYYEEPTTDDRARVDIHSKFRVARWTGIRRL